MKIIYVNCGQIILARELFFVKCVKIIRTSPRVFKPSM